ncbi:MULTISPECIES: endonuclease [Micromonospora]|uniref:endonuclease n=1 Tax=Micromonospora TaxID=1873 RepID=UPI001EE981D7|nr:MULTISPECIES: endonuclease [Micromonospora]MCG5449541.1 endonuclease [Micromonospora hortensis]MCX5115663.1 endonuclease [Micromonospora sp. NBC_00362]WTI06013.1 endonuclease [Micromonospora sp. NBC_00821]
MPSRAPKSSKQRGGSGKPKGGKLVRAAVQKASAKPVVRNNDLPEVTIKVKRKSMHARAQFDRKMNALKKLSDEGKLFKQANPVARDETITKGYKARIRQKIFDKYWPHDKKLSNKLTERLRLQQPDHVWELQLGGPDDVSNLKLLHGDTNRDVGQQIWQQIMKLPDGTPIRIEVVD